MPFALSWPTAPAIVAESLVAVPDALLTGLRPGAPASGAAVAGSLARSLGPPEDPTIPPVWLLPAQVRSFRRVLAAVRRFGGALLADPVGSGKTYVALAVAAAVNRGSTACLVPAALISQWEATADRLSIPVTLCSHEQISRGRIPTGTRGLVIIDESHHFRNPGTRRYRHLAPWLVGRAALLASATPVVNRMMDLGHQLLLSVPDDALGLHGVPSLTTLLEAQCAHPALGQLVFEQDSGNLARPRRVHTSSVASPQDNVAVSRSIDGLNQLRLSRSAPVAALIRSVLFRALASSPAAYTRALRRYRGLLLHARDAGAAGHKLDRAAVRRFTGEMQDQLVLWELFSSTQVSTDLELGDLAAVSSLLSAVAGSPPAEDGKLRRLRRLLVDGTPTLVFSSSRDTVAYLREQLHDLAIAWCTGERAGIGRVKLPRRIVLNWFRQTTTAPHAPRHLAVTDVAAEGLDLPRAARVVHYDLPWTPMRLEQREGRSVRYGSLHPTIEVVQFRLPPVLEKCLGLEATLARKQVLPAAAGLGHRGRHLWRWRSELADRYESMGAQNGVARVNSESPGLLAGFAVCAPGHCRDCATTVVWLEPDGRWTEAPEILEPRLESAALERSVIPTPDDQVSRWLFLLAKPIRSRLGLTRSRRWMTMEPSPEARKLMSRLQRCVKSAARRRDARELADLDRAMAFVAGGHTAGEAGLLDRLVQASQPELRELLSTLPIRTCDYDHLEVRLTGLILFQPAHPAPARVVSPECRDCRPRCSTSMEP